MKIAIFSDLHVEFRQQPNIDCSDADIIILAGDCHTGEDTVHVAAQLREQYRVPVLFIAGNHEHYHGEYSATLEMLRSSAKKQSVTFLENDIQIYDGVRFLGCTLWTNFCLYGDEQQATLKNVAKKSIRDFYVIEYKNRVFTPSDANELFEYSYDWLKEELAKPFDGKTVVITHFGPHLSAKHTRYPADDPVSPYFVSDCSALMQQFPIDLWIYGHTHNSVDIVLESGTRLVSNQKGYPNEDPHYTRFDTHKICEI